jgi:hypothetical protein
MLLKILQSRQWNGKVFLFKFGARSLIRSMKQWNPAFEDEKLMNPFDFRDWLPISN